MIKLFQHLKADVNPVLVGRDPNTGQILFILESSAFAKSDGWMIPHLDSLEEFADTPELHRGLSKDGEEFGWILSNGPVVNSKLAHAGERVSLRTNSSLWESLYITIYFDQRVGTWAGQKPVPGTVSKQTYLSHLCEIRNDVSELLGDVTKAIERGK